MGFPKYMFKCGTGKQVGPNGRFTADSVVVTSAEELAALGPGWCDSPVDAAEPKTPPADGSLGSLLAEAHAEKTEKHHKKAK